MSGSNRFGGDHNSPVGYGRPPVNRQFKPGQSGNPKGRPKGRKNLTTIVDGALNSKITVRDKNGPRTLSKLEAMVEVQINKAVAGDRHAVATIVQIVEKLGVFRSQPELNYNELTVRTFEKLERALGLSPFAKAQEEEPVSADKPRNEGPTQSR
jgi:hypothetical protein